MTLKNYCEGEAMHPAISPVSKSNGEVNLTEEISASFICLSPESDLNVTCVKGEG